MFIFSLHGLGVCAAVLVMFTDAPTGGTSRPVFGTTPVTLPSVHACDAQDMALHGIVMIRYDVHSCLAHNIRHAANFQTKNL